MSKIELKHIDKFYGKNHILKDVNLTIEDGDFMTLLGPSGCGKTTTLRVVSGLEKPQNGTIHMDGKEIVMNVKEGQKVIYSKYAGNEVKLDGEEYVIVRQSDILAIVE